jgi:hypothetical protein
MKIGINIKIESNKGLSTLYFPRQEGLALTNETLLLKATDNFNVSNRWKEIITKKLISLRLDDRLVRKAQKVLGANSRTQTIENVSRSGRGD